MKLEDMLHDWREVCEDFEVETDTFEGFMEHFNLTGEMMIAKSEDWGHPDYEDELNFHFYCGPSIGHGSVTDSIYFPNYLDDICKELDIKCDFYIAESYHSLINIDSIAECNEVFEKLKARIEQDIEIDIES